MDLPYICIIKEGGTDSQADGPQTAFRDYNLIGYPDHRSALNALWSSWQAPYSHPTTPILIRDQISVDEFAVTPGEWSGKVTWKKWIPDFVGDEELSGSVSLQTVKVNWAYKHVADYGPEGVPLLNSYGALGLKISADGRYEVEGVDIEFPVVGFTIKKTYPKGYGNINRVITLHDYAGKPNSRPWRGFGEQTCKLKGAEVSDEDDNEDVVTYTFEASPSIGPIVIATSFGSGKIVVPLKLGWQLLTITSRPVVQDGEGESGFTVDAPYAAHLDQPSELADYNQILPG